MAGLSVLRVVSNEQLVRAEQEQARREVDERQASPLLLGLAAHIKTCWDAARSARQPITDVMLRAMRQRNGVYEASKLQAIEKHGGSTVYMMLTDVKCRAAESWLRDILLDSGSPPWDLEPTPIPDIGKLSEDRLKEAFAEDLMTAIQGSGMTPSKTEQDQIREAAHQKVRFLYMQEAQNRVDGMKLRIEDQFAQGGWGDAFNEFITDLVTFPAAFVKGPIVRRQRHLRYGKDEAGNVTVEAAERIAPEYERVSPFDIYPEPGVTRINDGYLIQYHSLTRTTLSDLIGVPGYDDGAIRSLLTVGSAGAWLMDHSTNSREEEERKYHTERRPTATYDTLEFWGKVSGKMLRDWGLDEQEVPDPEREYDANVWMVGSVVIKAILNYDPLGEKPYAKTSMTKTPGSFWGRAIPEIIEDLQGVCNAAARALVNNMGIASGPQVEVNLDRIPPNEDITAMHPWKIWQVLNDPLGSSAPAVRFNQPTDNSNMLMGVYEKFSRLADDHSGIPAYIYGDTNVQGAGRTASGLSMLMGSAGKGIRQVVMHIDNDVIKTIVQRQFVYNMRYDQDETIKGDAQVVARGAVNLAVKETVNMRRVEFLNATANEIDMGIIGANGRAAILREVAKGLEMPTDQIVPSREQMAFDEKLAAASGAAQPGAPGPGAQQPAPAQLDPAGNPAGGVNLTAVQGAA